MKKILITFGFLGLLSCGKKESSDLVYQENNTVPATTAVTPAQQATPESPAPEPAANPLAGASLIGQNDCMSCHTVDTKLIGPAYREVAKKYSAKDTGTLAKKIIQGGSGNWGDVPMAPHPNISQEDAEKMASYILSLK